MLIRLSQTPATGSMLSIGIRRERPWRLTCLSEMSCRFRSRFLNSSGCSQMKLRARHTLSEHDGVAASSARTVERAVSPIVTPVAQEFFAAGSVGAKLASPPAPSWSARTRHSRCGFGRRTWSLARRRACRPSSSSAWHCGRCHRAHLCRALRKITTHYI